MPLQDLARPLAIAMWDFSWLERRWPGAGYEDWGRALDELKERGYDAVRIDAYPHLVALDAERDWELLPCWHFLDWGAPCRTIVREIGRSLVAFIGACRERGIRVGLSTWFRQDRHDVRLHIADAASHARVWIETLRLIERAGLLDAILYVDLCNEWPLGIWAPFFHQHPQADPAANAARSREWMHDAVSELRAAYPRLAYTFSFWPDVESPLDFAFLDFFEPHIWAAQQRDFYPRIGYSYQKFDIAGLENVALHAEKLYRSSPGYWQAGLTEKIDAYADYSRRTGRPLCTTECWAVVDYKDWPLLDWGWVKELCALGTRHAAATGRWFAIATSNFCGPQFRGMWRDVAWHRELTDAIHRAAMPAREPFQPSRGVSPR